MILVARQRALCYHGCPSLARQSRTRQGTGINVRGQFTNISRALKREMVESQVFHRTLSPFQKNSTNRKIACFFNVSNGWPLFKYTRELLLFARAHTRVHVFRSTKEEAAKGDVTYL